MSRRPLGLLAGALLVLSAFASPAMAEEGNEAAAWRPPQHRLLYRNLTVGRINPLGFQDGLELTYRYRLMDSDSILFRDSFVGLGATAMLTPAFTRLGLVAQAQPLAILYLEAKWQFAGWYGNFDNLQTYDDPTDDFSDAARGASEGGATIGWELDLTAELRLKVGPLVVRSRLTFIHTEMTPPQRPGDTHYYDPLYDLLMPTSGWALTNDADALLFLLDERLIVGVRYSLGHVFDGASSRVPTHRVGPLVAYRFFQRPGAVFDSPTALLLVQWYARHPYRAGQESHQAIPYLVLGFAFQGDLL